MELRRAVELPPSAEGRDIPANAAPENATVERLVVGGGGGVAPLLQWRILPVVRPLMDEPNLPTPSLKLDILLLDGENKREWKVFNKKKTTTHRKYEKQQQGLRGGDK